MSVKLSDQPLICSGGDGFEKPLQTPALQFVDGPTCGFIVGEHLFDGKSVLQQELPALHRRPGCNSVGPRRPGRRTSPSRHDGGSLGQFVEHLVCSPNSKGLRTLLKLIPTPCKTEEKSTQTQGAQSKNGFVPFDLNKK
jgi:hypothetical protein